MSAAALEPLDLSPESTDGRRGERRLQVVASSTGPQEFRKQRRRTGLSQERLADMLMVNHATVSRWESGHRRPPHDLLPRIADVLGTSTDTVEGWFASMPNLGGDTIGRLEGLKRLLCERQLDVDTAAQACGVHVKDLSGWVYGRRSLPRFMVPRLAAVLEMPESVFLDEARTSRVRANTSYLRQLRWTRSLTQEALGSRIGRSEAAICAWELGRVVPSPLSIRRLARALGVDPVFMCERMGWPAPPTTDVPGPRANASQLITAKRLEAGFNCAQLGRCVGVTGQTVRRWESGDFKPRRRTLLRLARTLDLPELLDMVPPRTT